MAIMEHEAWNAEAEHAPRRVLIGHTGAIADDCVGTVLTASGFAVEIHRGYPAVVEMAQSGLYCFVVVIVEVAAQEMFDFVRNLRAKSDIPLIIVVDEIDVIDKVLAIQLGADDYVPRSIHRHELVARVEAVLRRVTTARERAEGARHAPPGIIRFEGWTVDLIHRTVTTPDGRVPRLTGLEFELLGLFVRAPQEVLGRDALFKTLYGHERPPLDRRIDVLVQRLRAKLEPNRQSRGLIRTLRNGGYMLAVTPES